MRISTLRFAVVAATAVAVLAPGGVASADPSIAEIEAQIDTAWNSLEPTIEEYNKVHSALKANQAKYDELQKTLEPLELQVDLALSRVGAIAARTYKNGAMSTLTVLLDSGSPEALLGQLSIINQLSRNEMLEISAVKDMRDKYLADKAALDALLAELGTQDADLAAKKKTIQADITSLQKLRQQVYGTAAAIGELRPVACPYVYISGAAGTAASRACAQIGKKYVYGSAGPSTFDCSGLTQYAWSGGASLPHNAAGQYAGITHVSRADLRTGDLVFYYSPIHHVGIYVGGGWIVHAPQTGDYVRMAKVDRSGVSQYYGRPA
ncbi:MAG: NlpC/P60 family protein [Dactylosporangium sp.]|nr:C40 family peptidase [Dactylosporangium sp.]NNJ61576.1 NlpC/P60 family protein [Dactylosporangium sp.]